jgi:hypothetical protein
LIAFQEPYSIGIILGLIIGKPLGIVTFSWVLVKLKWGKLPNGVDWVQMIGIGILAGIGFTMSIFITTLAFGEDKIQNLAKIAILFASLFSGIVGFTILNRFKANIEKIEIDNIDLVQVSISNISSVSIIIIIITYHSKCDISTLSIKAHFDTIIMNPPFGTRYYYYQNHHHYHH